jgi:hypothetical protein
MDDKEDKNEQPFSKKESIKYNCENCDYFTYRKTNIDRHFSTTKHLQQKNDDKGGQKGAKGAKGANYEQTSSKFICCCGKEYKHRQGLWKHKTNCDVQNTYNNNGHIKLSEKEIIEILVEQNKKLMNLLENGTNNTTTNSISTNCNNVTNKTFNLNLYLNETCKDAMNISEFVKTINLNLEDLENTGRKGYVEGISNIIFKNLNNLEHHFRPLHCSDSKREIVYIKDNNEWTKESVSKPILTKAIKVIANENIKQIKLWRDKYPDCIDSDSKKNNLYLKIVSNSMNGLTEEESKKNIQKIISNVMKEVVIDKN